MFNKLKFRSRWLLTVPLFFAEPNGEAFLISIVDVVGVVCSKTINWLSHNKMFLVLFFRGKSLLPLSNLSYRIWYWANRFWLWLMLNTQQIKTIHFVRELIWFGFDFLILRFAAFFDLLLSNFVLAINNHWSFHPLFTPNTLKCELNVASLITWRSRRDKITDQRSHNSRFSEDVSEKPENPFSVTTAEIFRPRQPY